ncbi:MAG: 3-deoxy-8-phosphooctulonate synthase [Rickettsiales bacterium]|jgi:2-dehydro-3-deoxyphosphooctonate aldolase (KDO 8-P synthase)|nr:3-deoxy-8-phosphooctulonate synthase [Rickettsiales bacterium]
MTQINLDNIQISNNHNFIFISGPCQLESRDHAMMMAENLVKITQKLQIPYIFKASYDKANRSSISGKRGIGIENAIPIFEEVKKTFNCPVLTDIHNEEQARIIGASSGVDIMQIPAFLCRQTDLLEAAAKTPKIVNIKKGQFLAPWDMQNVINKVLHFGNKNIMLTERGASFGYNTLVTDLRSLKIMADTGFPVIFDATHSVQQPGGLGGSSGGQREFIETLARGAIATGIAGIFAESHQDPDNAPSDGPCMLPLNQVENFLVRIKKIDSLIKEQF